MTNIYFPLKIEEKVVIFYNHKKNILKLRRMKYRDLITIFVSILFLLSIGYTLGVNTSVWFLPVILFAVLVVIYYKLWK